MNIAQHLSTRQSTDRTNEILGLCFASFRKMVLFPPNEQCGFRHWDHFLRRQVRHTPINTENGANLCFYRHMDAVECIKTRTFPVHQIKTKNYWALCSYCYEINKTPYTLWRVVSYRRVQASHTYHLRVLLKDTKEVHLFLKFHFLLWICGQITC
jgi:hypothetical protein